MLNNLSDGYNMDLYYQLNVLETIITSSELINKALDRAKLSGFNNYYIGAGCITQTVWNYLFHKPLDYGIKDIDFVYYDDSNMDYEAERKVISNLKELYSDFNIDVDVKNQARVHLWYKDHFGYEIAPYKSLESAINTWPATASAIGVRINKDNKLKVYAPFGLNDLFGKIVRPNKVQITEEIYYKKTDSWLMKWPELTIIPWEI
ncbi:MAG: nucleotidyltransferase family protein [Anaerocolumna sp.]